MRFTRRSGGGQDRSDVGETDAQPARETHAPLEPKGPYDVSEVDVEDTPLVDLGSLLVTPGEAMELQLQVDEESGTVMAVVLVGEEGALELRAFAASRGTEAWAELRPLIAEETQRMGGSCEEQEGSFGLELLCQVPVQTPDGQQATQVSRILGHEGPAWLLRATLMGRPALEPATAAAWEDTIRRTVVRRGRAAMPPGSALPLTLPPEARRVDQP